MNKKISKALCFLIVASLTIIFFSSLFKPACAETRILEEGRHVGDLILSGNDYASLINRNMTVAGSIVIEENATLYLENATMLIEQTAGGNYNITLRNPANGKPRIIARSSILDHTNDTDTIIIYSHGGLVTATNFTTPNILLDSESSLMAEGERTQIETIRATDSTVELNNATAALFIQSVILDNSSAEILGTGILSLSARNRSNVTYSGGSIRRDLIVFANATVEANYANFGSTAVTDATLNITSTLCNQLRTRGNANFTAADCSPPYLIVEMSCADNSSAVLSNTMITSLAMFNASKLVATKILVAGQTSSLHAEGDNTLNVSNSQIDYPTLGGNTKAAFSNVTSKRVAVEQNATLIGSRLGIGENTFVTGNGEIRMANSTLRGITGIQDSAIAVFSNCGLNLTNIRDKSSASIVASSVSTLRVLDDCEANVSSSLVKDLQIQLLSVNGTFAGFRRQYLTFWNLAGNNSLALRSPRSHFPNLTLKNMQAPLIVALQMYGDCNVTIKNAELARVDAMDNSVLTLDNVTLDSYGVGGSAVLYSYWYLHIRLVDLQDAPVENVKVIMLAPSGEIIESGVTDSNGWFRSDKRIFASVINGTKVERSLILEVRKDDLFIRKLTADFASGYINLEFPLQTPWWQQYWYLIVLIAVLTASIVFMLARKR